MRNGRMFHELTVLALVALNGPNGQVIWVNPDQIVSIRKMREDKKNEVAAWVNCAIETETGKFVNTADTCDVVIEKLYSAKGHP